MSQQPLQPQDPLLRTLTLVLDALICSTDDLNRAGRILRQEAKPDGCPARTADDLCRIADQFSARARANQTALEAVRATGQSVVEGATSTNPAAPNPTPG